MLSGHSFRENISLKDYCTLGIGGSARYFLEIFSIEEMQQAIQFCRKENLSYFILGKGSNCLFEDSGFNGVVLLNKITFFDTPKLGFFHVGAGYSFSLVGFQTARQGWGGLEFASGIPGSVGGAVYMNAGANGQETCQTLDSVDYITAEGESKSFKKEDLHFSYRHSPFQEMGGAIVGATFALNQHTDARKRQIEIVNQRKKSQPLDARSAGCIFLNPKGCHAGALIEQAGLKGTSIGGAQVSQVHANFLINAGEASCQNMLNLIDLVKSQVKEKTGHSLKSEVRHIISQPGLIDHE